MVIAGLPWPRRRETVTGSVPEAISAEAWEWRSACSVTRGRPRAAAKSSPVPGHPIRVARFALDRSEDEGVAGEASCSESEAQFELSLPVLPKHGDGGGGQGDQAAPVLRFRRFHPESGFCLFD